MSALPLSNFKKTHSKQQQGTCQPSLEPKTNFIYCQHSPLWPCYVQKHFLDSTTVRLISWQILLCLLSNNRPPPPLISLKTSTSEIVLTFLSVMTAKYTAQSIRVLSNPQHSSGLTLHTGKAASVQQR